MIITITPEDELESSTYGLEIRRSFPTELLGQVRVSNANSIGTERLELSWPKPTDFRTTIVFTTLSVCGLDYLFTIAVALGAPRLVSTPSSCDAWLGIAILQVSPNLRSYTHKVS